MKKLFFILPLLALVACGKPVESEQPDNKMDSIVKVVFRAIIDSNYSCLDYQDAFYTLIDSMQSHVESSPDENIRIVAKSMAQDMCSLFFYGECCSPEEMRFFIDSLVLRLSDVSNTWYCYTSDSNDTINWSKQPILNQHIIFSDFVDDEQKHIICLDLYRKPSGEEMLAITLPQEAEYLASVVFHGEQMLDIDPASVHTLNDALFVQDKSEECGQQIVYGEDLIQEMLAYDGMFIAFIGNEQSDNIKEKYHDCHLLLTKFHEQYEALKQNH